MPASKPGHYGVIFKAADGEHIMSLGLASGRNDRRAREAAERMVKPPNEVVSCQFMPRDIYLKKVQEILAKYPNRIPIQEKTDGVPNAALANPELLSEEKDD